MTGTHWTPDGGASPHGAGTPGAGAAPGAPAEGAAFAGAREPHVVQTGGAVADGLVRCARCGATEIALDVATGMLRCSFCRFAWQTDNAMHTFGLDGDIGRLVGTVVGSGTADVTADGSVVTLRCTACGAEVVIDAQSSVQARCHWCRNTLSLTTQVPNGAVPDMVLPFRVTKEQAVAHVAEFVRKRTYFAHPRFRAEFTPENVMGVYLPYMVVDINAHARVTGQGEHQTRAYTVKVSDDKTEDRYDADLYDVTREFDLHVDDLTLESSQERLDRDTSRTSNNVINTIMPFDVENGVRYDPNYLAGFTSERRDVDLAALEPVARAQAGDIARWRAGEMVEYYDRGVRWDSAQIEVRGQRWVSAYLPVWLYSYLETRKDGSTLLHYVAVNGRTGETMGSVPLNRGRLLATSAVVQAVATVAAVVLAVVLL